MWSKHVIKDTYVYSIQQVIRRKDSGKLVGTVVRTPSNVYILENEEQCYMIQIDESFYGIEGWGT